MISGTKAIFQILGGLGPVLNSIRFLLLMFACSLVAAGQSFSSGSIAADGPLDLTLKQSFQGQLELIAEDGPGGSFLHAYLINDDRIELDLASVRQEPFLLKVMLCV